MSASEAPSGPSQSPSGDTLPRAALSNVLQLENIKVPSWQGRAASHVSPMCPGPSPSRASASTQAPNPWREGREGKEERGLRKPQPPPRRRRGMMELEMKRATQQRRISLLRSPETRTTVHFYRPLFTWLAKEFAQDNKGGSGRQAAHWSTRWGWSSLTGLWPWQGWVRTPGSAAGQGRHAGPLPRTRSGDAGKVSRAVGMRGARGPGFKVPSATNCSCEPPVGGTRLHSA